MRARVLVGALACALLVPFAPAAPAHAAALETEWLGRKCRPSGNTVAVVKVTNNSEQDRWPSYFYNYTDTGMVMGSTYTPAGESRKIRAVIPAGRKIAFLGIYKGPFSEKLIFERENIKALDCPVG